MNSLRKFNLICIRNKRIKCNNIFNRFTIHLVGSDTRKNNTKPNHLLFGRRILS